MKGNSRVEVCRKAFLSFHSISNKVVQRLTKLRETNQSPINMRGEHKNRGNILDPEIKCKMRQSRLIIHLPLLFI